MSCTRQSHDDAHDTASSVENGEAFDFSAARPMMTTPVAPTAEDLIAKPEKLQACLLKIDMLVRANPLG